MSRNIRYDVMLVRYINGNISLTIGYKAEQSHSYPPTYQLTSTYRVINIGRMKANNPN